MKLRAIVPDNEGHASTFWRITRPFEALRALGHDVQVVNNNEYHASGMDVKDAIVIIHRLIPADPEQYIKRLRQKGAAYVLYSIDDFTLEARALREYLTETGGMTIKIIDDVIARIPREIETINLCDELIVSTFELATLCTDIVEKEICILPNAIDEDWFRSKLGPQIYQNQNERIFIGYASGRRPEHDLRPMCEAWKRISDEFPNVWFVVAGFPNDIIDRSIDLNRKIRIPWKSLVELPTSMQVDIGCCPLAHTTFNFGKSPIKFFEYTLAGAATVVSPTVYQYTCFDSLITFFADSANEWYEKLRWLVIDRLRRTRLQETAMYSVHRYHTIQTEILGTEYHFKRMLSLV